jgi:hypothetical protein
MPTPYYVGPPGIAAAQTATHRAIFLQRSETFLAQGRLIDGTKSRDTGNNNPTDIGILRAGVVMGKITTGGKYANSFFDQLPGAFTNGTSMTLSAAGATELVRRIGSSGTFTIVGPPSSGGTVAVTTVTYSAVNTTTGVVTVTAPGANYIAGSFIGDTDGSQTPVAFIPDWDYGVKVLDANGASVSAVDYPKLPVSGIVKASQLLPGGAWPTDTSLQAWLVGKLNASFGGQYVFDYAY